MSYQIKLEQFEGPLDLLLSLIRKTRLSIQDVRLSMITEQYMEALKQIDLENIESASEFLAIAAILLEIKTRALLPRHQEEEDDDEDPEELLKRRLEEYRLYKAAAGAMRDMEEYASSIITRLPEEIYNKERFVFTDLDINDLIQAYKSIFEEAEEEEIAPLEIEREVFDPEMLMAEMRGKLRGKTSTLRELMSSAKTRISAVRHFLVLLELLANGTVQYVKKDGGEFVFYLTESGKND